MTATPTGSLFDLPLTPQTLEELFQIVLRRPTHDPKFVAEVAGLGLSVGEFARNLRASDELRKQVLREAEAAWSPDAAARAAADCAARTGLTPAALMAEFASLGDNCEFGLVQRRFEAEPVGMFRFSNPPPDMILHGARNGFADLGEELAVEKDATLKREWIVVDHKYRSRQHTWIFEGDPREEGVEARMGAHYLYLKRQLREDLREGAKIWVVKSVPNLNETFARELHAALRALGPNRLLFVVDEPGAPSVERLGEGLLKGRINGLKAEGHPTYGEFAWGHWLEVLVQAWGLAQ